MTTRKRIRDDEEWNENSSEDIAKTKKKKNGKKKQPVSDEEAIQLFFNMFQQDTEDKTPIDKIKKKISKALIPKETKDKLYKKLEIEGGNEKTISWFNEFLNIPFGKYSSPKIDLTKSKKEEVKIFFKNVMEKLDKCVGGLTHVKEEIINYVAQSVTNKKPLPRILALQGVAGVGKCLHPDTPVMLYSGKIVKASLIKVGDQLMGDDSQPRNVLSVCCGKDPMYKISQTNGDTYIVNEPHILSLKDDNKNVVDICLKDYIGKNLNYKGFKTAVNWVSKKVIFNPYLMGYWLNGGSIYQEDKSFDSYLKAMGLHKEKYIPEDYLFNDKENRLQLVAGFVDASCYTSGKYVLDIPDERLLKDFRFLLHSLSMDYTEEDNKMVLRGEVYNIPVVKRDRLREENGNTTISDISIEYIGEGDYCGFEIDGNRRFLLGDFTVTHNTKIAREGISDALNTPLHTFSMGGAKDSSHFTGFSFTYQGSKCGAISQGLMDSGVMNPVFVIDEIDKISETDQGEEIQNLLIHLTDPLQNHDFKDKYFDPFPIDLSRVYWILIFNDIKKISPILKDRMHIVKIPSPNSVEKLNIVKNYIIKEVSKSNNMTSKDFEISDEAIKKIIKEFSTDKEGMRNVKRCIETILLKINTLKLLGSSSKDIGLSFCLDDISLPIKVTESNLTKFLEFKKDDDEDIYKYLMYM